MPRSPGAAASTRRAPSSAAPSAAPRRGTATGGRITAIASPPSAPDARVLALEAELARERRVSSALLEVGTAMAADAEIQSILELILARVTDVLDADRATLYLLDDARTTLVSRVCVGQSVKSIRVAVGSGIAGAVARTGKPVRVRDAYEDRRFLRDWDTVTGYRTRSMVAAPMKNHLGCTVGVIQALNRRDGGEFSKRDEGVLTAMATQAAVRVENARLMLSESDKNRQLGEVQRQLEQRVRHLKLLFDLESAMARAASLDDLLRAAMSEAAQVCGARSAAVLLAAPDAEERGEAERAGGARLYFFDARAPEKPLRSAPVRPGEGFIGQIFASGRAASSDALPHDRGGARRLDARLGVATAAAIGAPLEGQRADRLGAIALYGRKGAVFSPGDVELLQLVAANVSTAVQLFRARVARERADRLSTIGRLLSGVIHDLKTPMAVVSGHVQLMVGCDDPRARADHARQVGAQFELVQQMQREVLEFARGERSVLLRKVYLHKFMSDLESALRAEIDGSRVALTVVVDDRGVARFDEGKITRALYNLVRNALEAMLARGGRLAVSVAREGGAVVFRVADTGPGIPRDMRSRLFDSFATSGKKGGTGLGLAIVNKIVDEHHGTIAVASSRKGTTFTLTLPQGA